VQWRSIAKVLSYFLFCFSALTLIPLLVAIYYDYFSHSPLPRTTYAFVITTIISLLLAGFFRLISRCGSNRFYRKESLIVVTFMWVLASVLAAVPFLAARTFDKPINALFESVSGFTTTGFTVVYPKAYSHGKEVPITLDLPHTDISYTFYGTIKEFIHPQTGKVYSGFDAIPRPILFWRSFTQWVGGLGIIFVFIAIFPLLNIGGKYLFSSETQSPTSETLTPQFKQTASALWKIYIGLTVLQIILMLAFDPNMHLLNATLITFSTISTGGFSPACGPISHYTNSAAQLIILFFMIFGAINFSLYFFCLRGNFRRLNNPELYFFIAALLLCCFLVIWRLFPTTSTPFLQGAFQTTSSLTCTGFPIDHYDRWPFPCQLVILFAMYIGGMTGSTAGGIKTARHLILFHTFKYHIRRLFRPNLVQTMRLTSSITITSDALRSVFTFFWLIIVLTALGTLLLVFDHLDLTTAMGLVSGGINNAGISFRATGPDGTCAVLSDFSKSLIIIWMLLGRLEFFAFFCLLFPSFWKKS